MERIINGRADMESAAKELRLGEIKEYKIKLAKTGMYYKIDRDKLEAYLSGGDRKFYEEVGTECEPLLNPYYKGNDVAVAEEEIDELDDLGESEQAPEAVEEVVEEVTEEVVENVAVEAIAEPSEEVVAEEEAKTCECEAKIAELEREKEELVEKYNALTLDYNALAVGKDRLEEEFSTLKNELDATIEEREKFASAVAELNKANVELTEKLQAPVDMAKFPLDNLVVEIASRGYAVELKYNK